MKSLTSTAVLTTSLKQNHSQSSTLSSKPHRSNSLMNVGVGAATLSKAKGIGF